MKQKLLIILDRWYRHFLKVMFHLGWYKRPVVHRKILYKGTKVYQYSPILNNISEVVYNSVYKENGVLVREIIIEPGIFYAQALNYKNAQRKFTNRIKKNIK